MVLGVLLLGLLMVGYGAYTFMKSEDNDYAQVKKIQHETIATVNSLKDLTERHLSIIESMKTIQEDQRARIEKLEQLLTVKSHTPTYPQLPPEIKVKFTNALPIEVYKRNPISKEKLPDLLKRSGIKK